MQVENTYYNVLIKKWIDYECEKYVDENLYKNIGIRLKTSHKIFLKFYNKENWAEDYYISIIFYNYKTYDNVDLEYHLLNDRYKNISCDSKEKLQDEINIMQFHHGKDFEKLFESKLRFESSSIQYIEDYLVKNSRFDFFKNKSVINKLTPSICESINEQVCNNDVLKYKCHPFDTFELLFNCIKCELSEKIEIFKRHSKIAECIISDFILFNIDQKYLNFEFHFQDFILYNEIYKLCQLCIYTNDKSNREPDYAPYDTDCYDIDLDNFNTNLIDDYCKKKVSEFINILDNKDKTKLSRGEFTSESHRLFKNDYITDLQTMHNIGVVIGNKIANYSKNELIVKLATLNI